MKDLIGKKILKAFKGEDVVYFETDVGDYRLYHEQYCFEQVEIVDIDNDLSLLNGGIVLNAEHIRDRDKEPLYEDDESYSWNFYKIFTDKASVTITAYGTSSGYYSEELTLERMR